MLYGRRKGRGLADHKKELLETLLPSLNLEANPGHPHLGHYSRRWAEIGFGYGHHLLSQAALYPDILMIGCEPFINGVASVLAGIHKNNLSNILIYPNDALDWMQTIPPAFLEKIFILFPDPWPKKRHHKRRIISPQNLSFMAQKLQLEGQLILATDHPEYWEWMLEVVKNHPDFAYLNPDEPFTPPLQWVTTSFQAKAIHPARFIFLQRK